MGPCPIISCNWNVPPRICPRAAAAVGRETGAAAHAGQTRKSGEPYITHPVAVAVVLAELGLDAETLVAAILHDTIEDTPLTREQLAAQFGETVAELVDGVTKLDKLKFRDRQEAAAESFRKMLLAMSRDLRVIMIKLADRLHNMRTLGRRAPKRGCASPARRWRSTHPSRSGWAWRW
jgi:guanosine-3',5'-bis(diphosphate) 3'-pyrophosphohydrolase